MSYLSKLFIEIQGDSTSCPTIAFSDTVPREYQTVWAIPAVSFVSQSDAEMSQLLVVRSVSRGPNTGFTRKRDIICMTNAMRAMPGRNESWQRTILSWNTSLNNLPAFLLKNGVVKAPRFYVVGWFPADIYKQNGSHSSGNPHALNDVTKFKSSPNVIPFVALVTKMRNPAGTEANHLTLKNRPRSKAKIKENYHFHVS